MTLNTVAFHRCVNEVLSNLTRTYVYTVDPRGGRWRFMVVDSTGKRRGDCEDHALTLGELVFGSKEEFYRAIKDGRAIMPRLRVTSGQYTGQYHAVLWLRDTGMIYENNNHGYMVDLPSVTELTTTRSYDVVKYRSVTYIKWRVLRGRVFDFIDEMREKI